MSTKYETEFSLGQFARIDNDPHIKVRITEIFIRGTGTCYEVQWFSQGIMYNKYVEEWRLTPMEAD